MTDKKNDPLETTFTLMMMVFLLVQVVCAPAVVIAVWRALL